MHRYGECSIDSGIISHLKGKACAAIPPRDWQLPIEQIKLIAEFTTPNGPVFDYFYVFVAGDPPHAYQIPMESLEPVGLKAFFRSLESELGAGLYHSLAGSVDFASSIMWPADQAGQPLLDFVNEPKPNGLLDRLRWLLLPSVSIKFSGRMSDFAGGTIEWAT